MSYYQLDNETRNSLVPGRFPNVGSIPEIYLNQNVDSSARELASIISSNFSQDSATSSHIVEIDIVQEEDRNNNIFTISDKNENRPIQCFAASAKTNLFTPSEPTSVLDVNNNPDQVDDSSVVCQNETSSTKLQGYSNVNGHKTKDYDFND